MRKNFLQSLIAVVSGNAIYFLAMPHLPRAAQHQYDQLDLGLVVDFWICLVCYGVVSMVRRWRERHTLR